MLDMLGEDARAAVGKVKSLQAQGATPEQIDAQMIEAARNGLLPISVAFAAQRALKRQNPPALPPQGTVVGDMMQQLGARQQGIAGLPAPVMDNAQYAGGGIVAFADAGMVGDPNEDDYLPRSSRRVSADDVDVPESGPSKPAGRLARLRSGLRKVGGFAMGKGPIGTAVGLGLLGLPFLMGDDEEEKKTEAAASEQPEVTLRPSSEYAQQPGGPGGIAELMSLANAGPGIGGYQQAAEQALAQYGGETDLEKTPTEEAEIERLAKQDEKYGIGKAREKQQARIDERRAKAEEEGSKSFLTELGLSFLTKGVMAAGEGKDSLSAMAYAVEDGAKSYKERKERVNAIIDKLDDAQAALDAQEEAALSGRITLARGLVEQRRAEIRQNQQNAMNIKLDIIKTNLQLADSAANRRLSAALDVFRVNATQQQQNTLNNLWNRYEAHKSKGEKAAADAAFEEVVRYTQASNAAFQSTQARLDSDAEALAAISGAGGKAAEGGDGGWSGERA
jgi:hypothetical protein